MKCQNCNRTVTRKTRFCPNCGKPIVHRKSQKQPRRTGRIPLVYVIGLLLLGGMLGFALFKLTANTDHHSSDAAEANFQAASAGQDPAVLDIAREFMCPCGACNDPLDVCTCDDKHGAVEVKSFIAQQLQLGHKKPHIVAMVQEEFGGLKKAPGSVLNLDFPVKANRPN